MIRRSIWVFVYANSLSVALAAPEPKSSAAPVCLYESKAYSEGAFVCVEKSLMLTCVSNGDGVLWKPVPDKDINDRCTAPTVRHDPPQPRLHAHRHHYVVRRFHPMVANPAKCFVFNGREYCE
jgi:Protein of unknown function (DUF1496)